MDTSAFEHAVESAIAGDHDALNFVWEQSRRWVAAILMAHKSRDTELDDLLQTVAMQMCRKMSSIEEPQAFRSWLRTVAMNVAREDGRKKTRHKRSMLRFVGMERAKGQEPIGPEMEMVQSDESEKIYSAAMALPIGYREPVLLRCVRSMSYQQIGDVLGLPVTTIETRIARGRRMLREMIEQQERQELASTHRREPILGGVES
ncbi:MAG: RNA polymerase sigma factor [Phycisphaerales bacterium]